MRFVGASWWIGGVRLARNPTAVQSGNRFATPLGERLRQTSRGNRLCERRRKARFMLSGPRRAQAGSHLPKASARYQKLGSASNLTRPTR